jgi:hypothetical protein
MELLSPKDLTGTALRPLPGYIADYAYLFTHNPVKRKIIDVQVPESRTLAVQEIILFSFILHLFSKSSFLGLPTFSRQAKPRSLEDSVYILPVFVRVFFRSFSSPRIKSTSSVGVKVCLTATGARGLSPSNERIVHLPLTSLYEQFPPASSGVSLLPAQRLNNAAVMIKKPRIIVFNRFILVVKELPGRSYKAANRSDRSIVDSLRHHLNE